LGVLKTHCLGEIPTGRGGASKEKGQTQTSSKTTGLPSQPPGGGSWKMRILSSAETISYGSRMDAAGCSTIHFASKIYKHDYNTFKNILESIHSFGDIGELLVPGSDPEVLKFTFEQAFALPCVVESLLTAAKTPKDLLASLKQWALDIYSDNKLVVVKPSVVRHAQTKLHRETRYYTASQCRGILANALLGNIVDVMASYVYYFQGSLKLAWLCHHLLFISLIAEGCLVTGTHITRGVYNFGECYEET
jgi:hypothetical protein